MVEHHSFVSCLKKQAEVELLFKECFTPDLKYQKIISIGREIPPYPAEIKASE